MTPGSMKKWIEPFRVALSLGDLTALKTILPDLFDDEVILNLCHPFGTLNGPEPLIEDALSPLQQAIPDLERRDMILLAGTTPEGQHWVGCMGNYMGTFTSPSSISPRRVI